MLDPKWFWYVARDDELMMDCDSDVLLAIALKRLERFHYAQKFVVSSITPEHFHLIVRLYKPRPAIERQIWQLYFMDHTYRSVNNLFRALDKIEAPALLISPTKWQRSEHGFWRGSDAECYCDHKHKGPDFGGCSVGLILRPKESRFNKVITIKR